MIPREKIKTGYAHAEPVSHNTINQNLPPGIISGCVAVPGPFRNTNIDGFFRRECHGRTKYHQITIIIDTSRDARGP